MNYEDELERSKAKRSRKRQNSTAHTSKKSIELYGSQKNAGKTESERMTSRGMSSSSSHRRRKKKNDKTKKIVIGIVAAIVLLIAVVGIGAYAYINHQWGKLQENEFDVEEVQNENVPLEVREKMQKGYWTVAVFGVDSRDGSLGKGNQSDVIMIANLNRETGEIKLVSVYRDTYLNINEKNTYNKINAAYATGGPEAAVKALNKNLDLNITHYATFNWKAVATVINILGGVDIDVSKSEFYYINAFITETVKGTGIGSTQLTGPGLQTLDGVQAVAYGRLRLMDTDYARTERQRIVIQKAFEKVKKADLSTLNDVVGHVFSMCATNIEFGDLAGLVTGISKYHMGETTGFPAARGEARIKIGKNNLSCVIPQTLESNVTSLHNFLYGDENYSPSSAVKEISAKIANITGMSSAGKEIGHVATDQGYVPKETAPAETAAVSTESSAKKDTSSSTETSASETTAGGSETTPEGENIFDPEEDDELLNGGVTGFPGESQTWNNGHNGSQTPEPPKSPADMTSPAEEQYGPGYSMTVPEATTASPGPAGPSGTSAVDTITDVIISEGSTSGPASQATESVNP